MSESEITLPKSNGKEEVDGEGEDDYYSDISLRLLTVSDVEDFMVWATDDKVSKFCSWDTYTSKEEAMKFIADVVNPHPWYRAICLKGRPIGSISVTPNQGGDSWRAELGYLVATKYWGRGIASKAVKMVASSVFREWPHLERLEALVDVENPGSQRVLDKAGFRREGVLRKFVLRKKRSLRDMVMFSLVSTDPPVSHVRTGFA